MPDETLVQRARSGDGAAFAELTEVVFRLVPEARFPTTHANGQPALAVYTRDHADGVWRASGLLVITVNGDRIAGLTRFESATLRPFGLPRILADDDYGTVPPALPTRPGARSRARET